MVILLGIIIVFPYPAARPRFNLTFGLERIVTPMEGMHPFSTMFARGSDHPSPLGGWIQASIGRTVDRAWTWLGGGHLLAPAKLGQGDHDCGPISLYWTTPWIPESRISDAFLFCAENWPHGGVTNKEFQIALKYLDVESHYSAKSETLGMLLARKPRRCVALLHGHFIAIINGEIVGRDARWIGSLGTEVYCHWLLPEATSRRRTVAGIRPRGVGALRASLLRRPSRAGSESSQ